MPGVCIETFFVRGSEGGQVLLGARLLSPELSYNLSLHIALLSKRDDFCFELHYFFLFVFKFSVDLLGFAPELGGLLLQRDQLVLVLLDLDDGPLVLVDEILQLVLGLIQRELERTNVMRLLGKFGQQRIVLGLEFVPKFFKLLNVRIVKGFRNCALVCCQAHSWGVAAFCLLVGLLNCLQTSALQHELFLKFLLLSPFELQDLSGAVELVLRLLQLSAQSVQVQFHVLDAVILHLLSDGHLLVRLERLTLSERVFVGSSVVVVRRVEVDPFLAQRVDLVG